MSKDSAVEQAAGVETHFAPLNLRRRTLAPHVICSPALAAARLSACASVANHAGVETIFHNGRGTAEENRDGLFERAGIPVT